MLRRVEGPSMEPTYRTGMLVFGLCWRQPRVGDIVIAELNGREIIKRVTDIGQQGYFLRGDNTQRSSDSRTYGWFTRSAIKSVVIGSLKRW